MHVGGQVWFVPLFYANESDACCIFLVPGNKEKEPEDKQQNRFNVLSESAHYILILRADFSYINKIFFYH